MKKDNLIGLIKEDYDNHNYGDLPFKVMGLLDLVDDYVNITEMFSNYYQIKELGITFKAYAKTEEGYDFLLDLGFPKSKIIKEYE